jgi:hypothetical protein
MYGGNTPHETPDLGAKYSSLKPEQKVPLDVWMRLFRATIQDQVDPEKADDNLPVSSRTTFNEVAHALLSPQLADESGGPSGSVIQTIDRLDTTRGEVSGANGDRQVPHHRPVEGCLLWAS